MALILVIDDTATMRQLVRRMLERATHTVLEAEDGEAGLTLIERQRPTLVITDLIMPNMEGIETIQQIKRSRPGTKIIAMSGGDQLNLHAAKKLGADAALAKPFGAATLLETIDRLLAVE
jgi:CheY-like chemotaxis protein